MSHRLRALLTLALTLGATWAADYTWTGGSTGPGDDNWSNNANWTGGGGDPNGATDTATFSGSTRPAPQLDAARTVNRVTFASTTGFTLGGGSTLTLGGSAPEIVATQGSHIIACDISLGANTVLRIFPGASLGFTGAIATNGFSLTFADTTPPSIALRRTRDLDGNGQIDAVDVDFSESMGQVQVGTWTVAGYTIGTPTWQSATRLRVPLTEKSTPDTGALPAVRYTAGSIADTAGNLLVAEGAPGTAAVDGAAPVIVAVTGTFGTSSGIVQFSEAVVSTTSGGNLDRTDLVYTPGSTSISSLTDANALDLLLTFTTGVAIASGDTIGAASGKIADLTGNGLGTAAVAITEPAATKDTVQDGSWDNPTTWLGGTLPLPSDNVVIRHNVTFPAQTGGDTLIYDTNSVKFDGGSLSAPPTTVGSAFTIIAVNSRVVEAVTNATVTNVQFYDYATSADFVFRVASSRTLTLSNSFQGHFVRIVVKQGPGVLVWDSPQNIYPFGEYDGGPTRIEAGTLRMNQANGRDPAFGLAIASGATLDLRQNFGSSDLTGQGTITRSIAGTAVLTLTGGSWGGSIEDGSGSVNVSLSGSNTWAGENSFVGTSGITLSSGGLALTGSRAVANTCPVSIASGTILTINANEIIGPLSGAGDVVLNADLVVNHAAAAPGITGVISGSGALAVVGSNTGALTLSGINTHTGGTRLGAGSTVVIGSTVALGASNAPLLFDGGRLRLNANTNLTAAAVQTSPDGSGPSAICAVQGGSPADRPIAVTANDGAIELGAFSLAVAGFNTAVGQDLTITGNGTVGFNAADPTLYVVTTAGTATWAGQLKAGSAFGFLCKRGAGSLAITNGGNTWISRVIRAEEGTLEFGASGALGTVGDWVYVLPGATGRLDNVTYASAPTLYLSGTLGVSGTSTWQGPTIFWSSTPIIDVSASSTLTLDGNVGSSASTSFAKSGAGTLVLATSNSFTLPVAITGGRVEVAANDRLGNAANAITLAGGTLGVTSGFTMARSVALGAGGGTIDVASGEVLAATGVFSGTSALIKTGGGELALSGANTYTGGTAISEGVLSIASANHLGASGGIALDGGILRSSASIVLAGRAVFLSGSSAVDVTAGTVEFPGVVSGNGKLSKLSAGTLALSGANTNTGLIVVSGGVLSARSATALGTAANPTLVENGATLELSGNFSCTEPLLLEGPGVSDNGVLRGVSGTQTLSGAIVLVETVQPAVIDVVASARVNITGVISGAGGLGKLGAGTLALNATNTFTGDVIVRDVGVLEIGANDRLGALTNEVLLAGGTLRATANIAATSRTVRVGSSGGTLHANTFTMNLSGIDTTASQPLTLAGPGTIGMLVPPGTSTLAGLLAGDANLNKSGGGTLVISSSANTFNGATSITNGRLLAIGNLPGPVSVLATGELAGSGPVGDTTVAVGGALSPGGNAPGVITLDSLVMQAGAVLNANLGNASDLVAVTGTATVRGSLVINAGAGFVDGIYQLLNATGGLTYTAGDMTLTSPPVPPPRFSITADGPKLLLTRDGANPTISAITSTSPDGTYNAGDIVNVRVVLSEPANLSGGLTLTLNTTPVATVTFPPSALATDFGTEYDGSYTVVAPEVAADLSVTAIAFIGAGAFTDTVGNTTSGALGLPPQNLGNLKNIAIVNQAPQVDINNAGVGVTTPSPFAAGAPGSIVEFTANSAEPTRLLVLASDPETADPALLTWTLRLDPSQGELQRFDTGSGSWVGLSSSLGSTTFTQAEVIANRVRYRHTTSVGGNDAVLLDCQDPQGSTSPLFLVRFTITGSGPPQVADFTDALTVLEPDTKPGSYTAIDGDVSVTDSDSPVFTGGTMILTVLNGTTGEDQLDLIAGATVGAGGAVSVGATGIGTVSGRGTTELSFVFSAGAGPTTVGALIRAIGYRFTALAPRNNVGRALRLRITDGSSGGGVTEAVKTVIIDPWNDPPVVAGADIATIPGLARNGAITASDPEGLSQAGMTLGVIANPTRGTLVFTPATGAYTYTPGFLSAATTGDVVTDTFIIGATDVAFAGGDARRIASPSDAAGRTPARTGQRTITVRITNSGAGGLAFRNAPRMTVTSGGIFSYEPVVSAPAGAALTYELVSDPGVTAFSTTTGIINWNPVTTPPAGGYHRFGILVTDTVSGTSAFLPIMLRVGPGGTG